MAGSGRLHTPFESSTCKPLSQTLRKRYKLHTFAEAAGPGGVAGRRDLRWAGQATAGWQKPSWLPNFKMDWV